MRPKPLFTQGLFFHGENLIESSGLYSQSQLNSYQPIDASYLKTHKTLNFPPQYFAEGAAYAAGLVHVLTWREGTLFKVDLESFSIVDSVFYRGEGWGMTTDGHVLYVSDGTDKLRVMDPESFKDLRDPILVKDQNQSVSKLNELEYLESEGLILANIFQSDRVAAISPESGQVLYYLDLSHLRKLALQKRSAFDPQPDVTNGLAVDSNGRLFATGKLWGLIFEIELEPISLSGD
jgi:glutamine cyclotransferase